MVRCYIELQESRLWLGHQQYNQIHDVFAIYWHAHPHLA